MVCVAAMGFAHASPGFDRPLFTILTPNERNPMTLSDATLSLIRKNVYGRELIYPACDISRLLVKLTDRKTFDENDLSVLREIGFELKITDEV